MFCIKCGDKLPDNANFCSKCGAKTHQTSDTIITTPTVSDEYLTCPDCRGKSEFRESCTSCNGSGREQCSYCYGSGYHYFDDVTYRDHIVCHHCQGAGKVHCDACAGSGWIIDSCSFCNHTGKVTQSELIVREKQLEREDEERKRKDAEAATRKIEAERLRTEQAVIAQQQREAEDARRVAILQHYMIVSFEEFAQATHTLWLSRKLQSISPFYEKEAKATAIDAFTSGFIASHQPFFTRYKFPVFHGETLITAGADTYLTTYRLLFKGPDKFYTIPLMDIEKYSFIKSGFLTGKPELSMSGLFGSIRWKGDRLNGLFFIKNKVMHLIRSLSIWETLPPHVHPILGKRIDDILQQPLP